MSAQFCTKRPVTDIPHSWHDVHSQTSDLEDKANKKKRTALSYKSSVRIRRCYDIDFQQAVNEDGKCDALDDRTNVVKLHVFKYRSLVSHWIVSVSFNLWP